jgi:acetyl coenzyme A synthetase (ADP forming)-like protein
MNASRPPLTEIERSGTDRATDDPRGRVEVEGAPERERAATTTAAAAAMAMATSTAIDARAPGRSLDPLFRPRSVAVVGASRRRGTIAGEVFHNLVSHGFPGPVDPVNPAARAVQSVRACSSIDDVPGEIDLAVVVVPQPAVLDTVQACARRGVRGIVVITAGFAEVGPEGKQLQDELVRVVRSHGIRMVGPNCLGLLNTEPAVQLDATFAPTWPPAGPIAIASQSGAVGLALLDYARDLGIGISQFISTGNKADVSGNDLLEYWEDDPSTRVILLYLESLGNPARFMQIARRVSRKKPIVVVKSGRTAAGARAASSHTGALAGMDVAVDALLGQAGVVRTDTMEELFDLTVLLANQPPPVGARVAILTNAGGPAIMASDACESRGLALPALDARSTEALRAFLPAAASAGNPVDMLASATADDYERALRILLADPSVDSVIVLFVPPLVTEAAQVADAIQRAIHGASKPVLACLIGTHGVPAALEALRRARVPAYAFPEGAVLALARAVRYGRWLLRAEGAIPELAGISRSRARRMIERAPAGWLPPDDVRELLAAYGLRVPRSEVAPSAAEATRAAEAIGYPVALKLVSRAIVHKTEVGGVHLDLSSADEVRGAFEAIRAGLAARGLADQMEGAVVQEMVTSGVEAYVGVTNAPGFGALVGFGTGGVNVELWRDVVFRVHPLTDVDAREMLEQIRGRPLLEGFRGAPPADQEALVQAILRVDRMVGDNPEIEELDLNPLVALAPGHGVVAIDARVRIARP